VKPRVLIVDDEQNMCEMLATALDRRGFDPTWRLSAEEGLEVLAEGSVDLVLTDIRMPNIDGIEFCQRIVANRSDIPVVVMTAFGSLETAIAAIRAGAYDFVTKPIQMDVLALALQRAAQHRQLQEQVRVLSDAVQQSQRFDELIGASSEMQKLYDQLSRIAQLDTAVLISGESGTGKELVARSIRQRSSRQAGPFITVNCAALPEQLLESELFGHERGAFTDARSSRKGLFLEADGGTLLLDEIGEMPLSMQAKLLRVLEESKTRPVGSDKEVAVDVRVISATNRDLEAAIEEQRFREDLFYRINVIQVDLPPLRARGSDVLLLAKHFVQRLSARLGKSVVGISEPAAERLLAYSWPGNVRELRNVMERSVALTRFDKIVAEDLPEKIQKYRSSQVFVGGEDPTEFVSLEEVENRYIEQVMRAVGGNKALAARILGLSRRTLYRKLERIGYQE
jgi:two-component system response regulator HydG